MAAIANPITDPIGFLIVYFIIGLAGEGLVILFKLGLITSIISIPFVLLSRWLLPQIENKYKWSHIKNLLFISFLSVILFWIVVRFWYLLSGGAFFATDLITIISFVIMSSIIVFFFVLLGDLLFTKTLDKLAFPKLLIIYIICLLINILFWICVWLLLIADIIL